ncbi:hypothetical protein FXO37_09263 [Capsicum annuum]|nr:hypothetical protein FXO37_09263 [Capsicum annuum]
MIQIDVSLLASDSKGKRCMYVYDSLSSVGHDVVVLAKIEKLVEVISLCLVACNFYEKKDIDIDNYPNYKFNDKFDLFDVSFVDDLPQQPSGSLSSSTRYASLLWYYGSRKEKKKAQSDDEAPMRPHRKIGITEDTEVLEI